MALRTKTVEYAFSAAITSVNSGSARNFSSITVYIPENTTRTFKSVWVEFSCLDNGTAASLTNYSATLTTNGTGSNKTSNQGITNSGENNSFMFTSDHTADFATSFGSSATSQTVSFSCTVSGPATLNGYAKLIITYEYDDSAATTRLKTVRIPIDGNTGSLTTTLANLGGVASQIPALDTFLPEASKTYRSIFFEWLTHTGTTGTTGSTLTIAYNGTNVVDTSWASGGTTDTSNKRIDNITAIINTTATNSLQASCSVTTGRQSPCLNGILVVTYEYDHSTTTSVLNSLMIPIMDEAGFSGATTTTDKSRFTRKINVQEPGTITLVQSAVQMSYVGSAAMTIDTRIGSQTSRTFAHPATMMVGNATHMRRLDADAVGGAGMTLARGFNDFVIDWFSTSKTLGSAPSNMSGVLYLNYTSGVHPNGDAVHSHTVKWLLIPYAPKPTINGSSTAGWLSTSGEANQITVSNAPVINATNYWLVSAGFELNCMYSQATALTNVGIAVLGEIQSSEAEGAGWRPLYTGLQSSDTETGGFNVMYARSRDDMKRWPLDTDTSRLDIETVRDYRIDTNCVATTTTGSIWQMVCLTTWHAMTAAISGTISGSNGGTVNIKAFDDNGILLGTTSRTGDGTYSITWYDDTELVYVVAYEDSTHNGATYPAAAGSTFDIDLSSGGGGGGGPTYYAYV